MVEFTKSELRALVKACRISHSKLDLELRKVRRNRELIDARHADHLLSGNESASLGDSVTQCNFIIADKAEITLIKKKIECYLKNLGVINE